MKRYLMIKVDCDDVGCAGCKSRVIGTRRCGAFGVKLRTGTTETGIGWVRLRRCLAAERRAKGGR
jgi:hypothetical protein